MDEIYQSQYEKNILDDIESYNAKLMSAKYDLGERFVWFD